MARAKKGVVPPQFAKTMKKKGGAAAAKGKEKMPPGMKGKKGAY